ncbi:uncharacterized protein LOC141620199 [Silene latifolia]|uniref:uncharacterized protein LOC141620199 n=1 Tax=Silene latifolia TaxID=37657 RepID=UPI003D78A9D4
MLTGDNYEIWTKAIINALDSRNKFGFVNGDFCKPADEKSTEFAAWKSNNSIICSWIFNSVDVSIQPSIVSHNIASELWADLKERYSTINGPRINQLKSEYHNFRQKELSVVSYYNKFKGLWDELYGSVDVTCGCSCSAATKLRARAAEEQVHDFVLGLNDDKYNTLRTQILSMDPIPTINKAFSLATQEERHKSIVRDRDDKTEAMSFIVQRPSSSSAPPHFLLYPPFRALTATSRVMIMIIVFNALVIHLVAEDAVVILEVVDRNSRMPIGVGEQSNGVYYYRPVTQQILSNKSTVDSTLLLHRRLGHPSRQHLSFISSISQNNPINKLLANCDVCIRAKQTRSSFPISLTVSQNLFDLIHCDLWGPYSTPFLSGAHYFLTIVDDHSRAVWVYLINDKSEVPSCMKNFCAMVRTQFSKEIKIIRSDNGTEFVNSSLRDFYSNYGILLHTSCVDTPQQNGRVERKHRNILEVARALRFQASLPITYWGECVQTAVFLINRTPTALLNGKSPYSILFGSDPNLDVLRTFGCLCYVHYRPRVKDKFGPRSRRCVFLGYHAGKKGWKVMDLEQKTVTVSRDVRFMEDVFPFASSVSPPADSAPPYADFPLVPDPPVENRGSTNTAAQPSSNTVESGDGEAAVRRGTRIRAPPP